MRGTPRQSSCSQISRTDCLGETLAALTVSPTLRFVKSIKPSIYVRELASAISIALLLGAHTTTKGYDPYAKLACFYVAGLCVFSAALVFQALLKRFERASQDASGV